MISALLSGVVPLSAAAFWSIFPSLKAATDETPALHDASLPLLEAAVNPDPNPVKGAGELAVSEGSALVADALVEGSAVPYYESTGAGAQISTYIVRPGDSVAQIAQMFNVSANTILWANNLKSVKDIHPGDTLLILPVTGVEHTVAKGETLAGIAKKYGASVEDITSYNGIDAASLTVGAELIIPGGELAVSSTAKASSGSSSASSPAAPKGLAAGGGKVLSGFWINPVPGAILTQGIHDANAVDLGIKVGTPIHAAAAGKVIFVSTNGSYNHGWGNDVIIDHGNGTQTLYAHMSTVSVSVGQSVSQNDVIGAVGMTGRTTGAHLHVEFHGAKNPFASCALRTVCHI